MHARNIEIEPEARDDLAQTFTHYELAEAGLGKRFLAAFNRRLDLIAWNPRLYGRVHRSIRACMIPKYPQVIYYRILRSRVVVVLAVRHGRERPGLWRGRH